jgi:hypothetical protein
MRFIIALLCCWGMTLGAWGQDIEPAVYKKDKKVKYSYKYTTYTDCEGYNIPSMRVPEHLIRELKSPAAGMLIEMQALLEAGRSAYWSNQPVMQVDRMRFCMEQLEGLDPYWELTFLKLELDFYADYEARRYQREVVAMQRADSLNRLRSKKIEDSLRVVFANENKRADSLERARERYLYSKRDSILFVERVRGYHFVNRQSINLHSEPDPRAPLIVNIRVCSYLKVLSEPDRLGYVYVEVSDYKGYTLYSQLVDDLKKITVPKADVKFARENHYVSIYIPAGATYDPLRPHLGTGVPTSKSPTDTTAFVYKPYVPQYIPKEKTPTVEKITDLPKEEPKSKKNQQKTEEKPKKQTPNSGGLHQCTGVKSDGSACTNMTTSKTKKCYLHDE